MGELEDTIPILHVLYDYDGQNQDELTLRFEFFYSETKKNFIEVILFVDVEVELKFFRKVTVFQDRMVGGPVE